MNGTRQVHMWLQNSHWFYGCVEVIWLISLYFVNLKARSVPFGMFFFYHGSIKKSQGSSYGNESKTVLLAKIKHHLGRERKAKNFGFDVLRVIKICISLYIICVCAQKRKQ